MKKNIAMLVFIVLGILLLYRQGRSIWFPVLRRFTSQPSIEERINHILSVKPHLKTMKVEKRVELLAYKEEKEIDVYIDGRLHETIPVLAASGNPGPKLQEGDRQVPEGVYRIDLLNPASSFYLSMRVSYPNQTDLTRSAAAGINNPGSDIYVHGKAASIGCLAVGDDKIEDLFYLVHIAGKGNTGIAIAPGRDLTKYSQLLPENIDLYNQLGDWQNRVKSSF